MNDDDIIKRSNGRLVQQAEIRDDGRGYAMFNDASPEVEICSFLYAFVRVQKPKWVLSTGIREGISDAYIGQALQDNGFGELDAIEFDSTWIAKAKELWRELEIHTVTPHLMSSLDFTPAKQYGLMFLDTEMNLRFHELVRFFPYLDEGGFVFIHDMPVTLCQGNINPDHPDFKNWPVGEIPQEVKNWVKDGELRPFHFNNPRGLLGFYKTRSNEYKWL